MTIVFTPHKTDDTAFIEKCFLRGHSAIAVGHAKEFTQYPKADLFIDAAFEGYFAPMKNPLLFHSPAFPFGHWPDAPDQSGRICAWPGFWERERWEIALKMEHAEEFHSLLTKIGIQPDSIPDIAGLVAPRILCTLINEAAYTFEADIASEADMDIAMKLGTNYPLGPMEWARKIGFAEIRAVLEEMAHEDARYTPCPYLEKLELIKG